jgi:hypothetical protein
VIDTGHVEPRFSGGTVVVGAADTGKGGACQTLACGKNTPRVNERLRHDVEFRQGCRNQLFLEGFLPVFKSEETVYNVKLIEIHISTQYRSVEENVISFCFSGLWLRFAIGRQVIWGTISCSPGGDSGDVAPGRDIGDLMV